jgi:signal transduction histidine kinase
MSHDLRTPLAGLRALAEGLEDGVISDVPRALSHLRSTVGRMAGLVDALFALSRVQGGPVKPQSLVSLTELISDVASESAATAAARASSHRRPALDDRLAVRGSADDLARALVWSPTRFGTPRLGKATARGQPRRGRSHPGSGDRRLRCP